MTPDKHTNQELFLDVGDNHQLYVQDWGNKDAKTPIIFLHGGPGLGCDDNDKKKFNPQVQHVIFHDQRGAGNSRPPSSMEHNTTDDLVSDIQKIANKLKLSKYLLIGSSWGSALALLSAITQPQPVAGLIIDGVFTVSKTDLDWLSKGGWRTFFPDVWQAYTESVPTAHRADPTAYHLKQALGNNSGTAKKSAYEYEKMESALLKLDDAYQPGDYATYDPSKIKIEMHYTANDFFLPPDHILKHAPQLTAPVYLIAGRYDMICPPQASYNLDQLLPNSNLIWTINGHLKQHEAKTILSLLVNQLTEKS